jgi:ankyrin repeat protein
MKHIQQGIQILRNAGANMDSKNKKGRTALHSAAHVRNIKLMKFLINSGVKTNIKNKEKRLAFEIVQTNNENEGKPAVDFKKYLKQ